MQAHTQRDRGSFFQLSVASTHHTMPPIASPTPSRRSMDSVSPKNMTPVARMMTVFTWPTWVCDRVSQGDRAQGE